MQAANDFTKQYQELTCTSVQATRTTVPHDVTGGTMTSQCCHPSTILHWARVAVAHCVLQVASPSGRTLVRQEMSAMCPSDTAFSCLSTCTNHMPSNRTLSDCTGIFLDCTESVLFTFPQGSYFSGDDTVLKGILNRSVFWLHVSIARVSIVWEYRGKG